MDFSKVMLLYIPTWDLVYPFTVYSSALLVPTKEPLLVDHVRGGAVIVSHGAPSPIVVILALIGGSARDDFKPRVSCR